MIIGFVKESWAGDWAILWGPGRPFRKFSYVVAHTCHLSTWKCGLEDQEFKVVLGHIVSLRPALGPGDAVTSKQSDRTRGRLLRTSQGTPPSHPQHPQCTNTLERVSHEYHLTDPGFLKKNIMLRFAELLDSVLGEQSEQESQCSCLTSGRWQAAKKTTEQ